MYYEISPLLLSLPRLSNHLLGGLSLFKNNYRVFQVVDKALSIIFYYFENIFEGFVFCDVGKGIGIAFYLTLV